MEEVIDPVAELKGYFMSIKLCLLAFFFLCAAVPETWSAKCKETRVITEQPSAELKSLFKQLKGQFKDTKESMLSHFFEGEDLGLGGKFFLVDINNDGKQDAVFTYSEGSGGYESIEAFTKAGDKYEYLGEPPKPKSEERDGPWYLYLHRNRKTKNIEFLIAECGKTFMQFDLGGEGTPVKTEKFLWSNGETKKIHAGK